MSKETYDLPSIFSAAIAIQDIRQRFELVNELCQGKKTLVDKVNALLEAHESARNFLSSPPQVYEIDVPDEGLGVRQSVLQSLTSHFPVSPVALRDDHSDISEPIVKPNSTEVPSRVPDDKYQLQGEIARGGMGAVLKGRDVDLGRSLAIKVLLDDHKDNPQIIQRFVEEAQIGGQLQHPGITPVYELGQFADQRPFFTMKLVKGKTLAAMLSERTNVFDRGKLLGIFEQICQTMAYAHSRGVIHRDLKPANIMVGAFGEVQVMDWGLAKVLEAGGTADEKKARHQQAAHSVIHTLRRDGSGPAIVGTAPIIAGETLAGSVMGTPAYMPPEQARGEVERLDERCDVFGLGAILCEILTGRPPYFDDNPRDVLLLAQRGNPEIAFKDLDMCRADTELVEIAKESLAPEPTRRIRDAKVLAERVSGYLESVEAKLHETELARATEKTRAVEARKRQRVTLALAASILLTLGMGTAAWLWNQSQFNQRRMAATDRVNEALGEARLQSGLAASAPLSEQAVELEKAIANANTANELAENDSVNATLKKTANELLVRLEQQLQSVQKKSKLAEADQKLKEKLEFIRLSHADGKRELDTRQSAQNFNIVATGRKYRNAFRDAGHDLTRQTESELVNWTTNSDIRETLISAMDHWSRCLPSKAGFEDDYRWTQASSWEGAIRIAKDRRDAQPDNSHFWMHLGGLLIMSGDESAYQRFCEEMLAKFGRNRSVSIQGRLCKLCLIKPGTIDVNELPTRWETFLDRPFQPANTKMWHPWAWNARAMLAYRRADYETAKTYAEKSEANEPIEINHVLNLCVLALAEHQLGHADSAKSNLELAIETLNSQLKISTSIHHDHMIARAWIREGESAISPGKPPASFVFDQIPVKANDAKKDITINHLLHKGSLDDRLFAIASAADSSKFRKSVRSALRNGNIDAIKKLAAQPDASEQPPETITSLATALREADELDLAISILRNGQRDNPGDFWINFELGKCLIQQEDFEEGIGFARAALAARPNSVGAMWAVTAALMDAGQNQPANEQFKLLLAKSNLSATGFEGLATSMANYGNYQAALLAIEKALKLEPKNTIFLSKLAGTLAVLDREEEAIEILERAIRTDKKSPALRDRYAQTLWRMGRRNDAIEQARESAELLNSSFFYNMLGTYLGQVSRHDEALESFEQAALLAPNNERIQSNLAAEYSQLGRFDEAGELRSHAIEAYAKLEKKYRKDVSRDPRSARAHYKLGYALYQQRKYVEAAASFAEAIRIDGQIPTHYYKYGHALWQLDQKEEALEQWNRALALNSELAKYHERVGFALKEMERYEEAIPYYQQAVKLNPDYAHAKKQLLSLKVTTGKIDPIEEARKAISDDPDNPRKYMVLAWKLFRAGKLAESEEVTKQALKLDLKQPAAIVQFLGAMQIDQGKIEEGIATFKNAIEVSDHSLLRSSLARAYAVSLGDLKQGEVEFRKALEIGDNPFHKRLARIELINLYIHMERFEEAEALFAVDKGRITAFPMLRCQQIYAQYVQGKKDKALKAIEKFVNRRSKLSFGYVYWAEMLIFEPDEEGKYPDARKALEVAKKALEIQSNDPDVLTTLGAAQYRSGDDESAIATFNKAEQLGARRPAVWLYQSMIHSRKGELENAKLRLKQSQVWMEKNDNAIPQYVRLAKEAANELKQGPQEP